VNSIKVVLKPSQHTATVTAAIRSHAMMMGKYKFHSLSFSLSLAFVDVAVVAAAVQHA